MGARAMLGMLPAVAAIGFDVRAIGDIGAELVSLIITCPVNGAATV